MSDIADGAIPCGQSESGLSVTFTDATLNIAGTFAVTNSNPIISFDIFGACKGEMRKLLEDEFTPEEQKRYLAIWSGKSLHRYQHFIIVGFMFDGERFFHEEELQAPTSHVDDMLRRHALSNLLSQIQAKLRDDHLRHEATEIALKLLSREDHD